MKENERGQHRATAPRWIRLAFSRRSLPQSRAVVALRQSARHGRGPSEAAAAAEAERARARARERGREAGKTGDESTLPPPSPLSSFLRSPQKNTARTFCMRTYGLGPRHVSHTIGKSERSQPSASGSLRRRPAIEADFFCKSFLLFPWPKESELPRRAAGFLTFFDRRLPLFFFLSPSKEGNNRLRFFPFHIDSRSAHPSHVVRGRAACRCSRRGCSRRRCWPERAALVPRVFTCVGRAPSRCCCCSCSISQRCSFQQHRRLLLPALRLQLRRVHACPLRGEESGTRCPPRGRRMAQAGRCEAQR